MPSRVIRPTQAPAPAPFAYTIGTADGLAPEAVFAAWDGSGAGGDFLPCVSYYSAEGVLLDRAFPDSGAVTAGDTAEISYRPFKRGGGGQAQSAATFVAAHVTGGVFTVPLNNAQIPLTIEAAQGVLVGVNSWQIQTAGWYLCFGQGGFTRFGPTFPRERLNWTMHRTGAFNWLQALTDMQDALLAGEFLAYTMSACAPLFLQAGETWTLFATSDSSSGSMDFAGEFGVWKIA